MTSRGFEPMKEVAKEATVMQIRVRWGFSEMSRPIQIFHTLLVTWRGGGKNPTFT